MSEHPSLEQLDLARRLAALLGLESACELLAEWCGTDVDQARHWIESPYRDGHFFSPRGH